MNKTDKKCKLDITRAELFTLDELYEKQGFPFRAIKLRDENPKPPEGVEPLPLFVTLTFTKKCSEFPGGYRIKEDPHVSLIGYLRQWSLL